MQNRHVVLSLALLAITACDPSGSDSERALESNCDAKVTFGAEAVQIDACSDIVNVDVVYADGTQTSAEYAHRHITLPQVEGNPILSIWVEPESNGDLGLRVDAPEFVPDLIPVNEDDDNDGVLAADDCDDNDPRVGALLYENDFSNDDGYLGLGPKLQDPWSYDGEAHTSAGGQQALLGQAESWGDTVTFGRLRLSGVERACGQNCQDDNTRFRAGFLSRTTEDGDQDEGYHGYRCAVARNSGADCYDEGPFVQLAAFLDGPEDDIQSECVNGCAPNPTFEQLDRQERSEDTNFIAGDSGMLTFWAVGRQLVCEFDGNNNEHVVARAHDPRFSEGTTGLSTLNALADFDYVRVCQAFAAP